MALPTATGNAFRRGFTLVELLVALAIIATLLSIVAPRYVDATERAREAALRVNLKAMRDAIDHFHGDRGVYPETLEQLVQSRYLRAIPADPITGRQDDWRVVPPPPDAAPHTADPSVAARPSDRGNGVYDVRSSAPGSTRDGVPYDSL